MLRRRDGRFDLIDLLVEEGRGKREGERACFDGWVLGFGGFFWSGDVDCDVDVDVDVDVNIDAGFFFFPLLHFSFSIDPFSCNQFLCDYFPAHNSFTHNSHFLSSPTHNYSVQTCDYTSG
jgi:hypothetical protein